MKLRFTEKAFKVLQDCPLCMIGDDLVGTPDEKTTSAHPFDPSRAQRVPDTRSSTSFDPRRGGRMQNMPPASFCDISKVEDMFRKKK